jgi:hypothetical protein
MPESAERSFESASLAAWTSFPPSSVLTGGTSRRERREADAMLARFRPPEESEENEKSERRRAMRGLPEASRKAGQEGPQGVYEDSESPKRRTSLA